MVNLDVKGGEALLVNEKKTRHIPLFLMTPILLRGF